MVVAFAKATLLERLLLLADDWITEAEYMYLLRYMVRSEFGKGGTFEPLASIFATELSDETYRHVTTKLVNRMEFLKLYEEWVGFLAKNPDEVNAKRVAVLADAVVELRSEGVFPELRRLRIEGPTPQNSLADLARNRSPEVVAEKGVVQKVEWISIRDLIGPFLPTAKQGRATERRTPTGGQHGEKGHANIAVNVVRERKEGGFEVVNELPVQCHGSLLLFPSRRYTKGQGSVEFSWPNGSYADVRIGGKSGDSLSKQLWQGNVKGNMQIDVKLWKNGRMEVTVK